MRRWTWWTVAACALGWAAPAHAHAAIDLGQGDSASVALDGAGTAHIAFNAPDGEVYCRLPRGARACDVRTFLPLPARAEGPIILRRPSDGLLVIVQGVRDAPAESPFLGNTYVRYSADGGVTWLGPVQAANGSATITSALLSGDGASVFTLDPGGIDGLSFQRGPLAGGGGFGHVVLEAPVDGQTFGEGNGAELALQPDGRMMETNARSAGIHWRFFTGGDPLDPNAWRPEGIIRKGDKPHVASGPRGTWLLEFRAPAKQSRGAYRLRRFDAKRLRWSGARPAGADRRIFGDATFAQDAAGRLHALAGASVGRYDCIMYARTGKRRSSWFGRTTTLWRGRGFGFPQHMRLAVNPDGSGVAVWEDFQATRSGGSVRVVPLRQAKGHYRPIRRESHRPGCVKN